MKKDEFGVLYQLGRRIAYLRKQAKKSQLILSIEADVSKSYLSDLELGKRNPSVTTLNKICVALNVSLEELFKGISDISLHIR